MAQTQAEMIEIIRRNLDELAEICGDPADGAQERLVAAILGDPPAGRELIGILAGAAGWTLPRRVAAAVLACPGRPAQPAGVLADWRRAEPCLIVPDPDGPGRAAAIDRALDGCAAVIGPTVPLTGAAWSLRCAQRAAALVQRDIIAASHAPVRCAQHLTTLLLLADEELAMANQAARLAPLLRLPLVQRDRLAQTLFNWLQRGENATEVAHAMHIHPQTVRYRLRQLRRLFGEQLRDPYARYDILVALRTHGLLTYGESGATGSLTRNLVSPGLDSTVRSP